MVEREDHGGSRLIKAAVYSGVGVGLSAAATIGFANHAHEEMPLGAHQVDVTPTGDGYATLEFPGIVKGRVPVDTPLGLGANVEVIDTDNIETALQQDALIATQPQGEIDSLQNAVTDLWLESASKGVLVGIFAVGGIGLAVRYRKGNGDERLMHNAGLVTSSLAVGATAAALMIPGGSLLESDESDKWSPLVNKVPILKQVDHPAVETIEIDRNSISEGTMDLVNSAARAYQEAGPFYEALVDKARLLDSQLRQPEEDETVVLQVTDRHDNIPMDAVARAIGDAGGATIVISTGDDTSVGGEWEAFSLNSLNSTFEDYEERIVVPGNHDEGPFVSEYLASLEWDVLSGEAEEIGGITWVGDADPRSSGLGDWVDSTGETISDQSERLADVACEIDDEPVTIATHSPSSAREALARGCAELAISGHYHRQVGPDEVVADSGEIGVTFTSGTTGGAVFAFALTDKIKKDAQVALITYKDGAPIGLQPVTITTGGDIIVQEFYTMPGSTLAEKEPSSDKRVGTLSEGE